MFSNRKRFHPIACSNADATATVRSAVNDTKAFTTQTILAAGRKLGTMRDALEDSASEIRWKAGRRASVAARYVKDRPVLSALIISGAVLALATLAVASVRSKGR